MESVHDTNQSMIEICQMRSHRSLQLKAILHHLPIRNRQPRPDLGHQVDLRSIQPSWDEVPFEPKGFLQNPDRHPHTVPQTNVVVHHRLLLILRV